MLTIIAVPLVDLVRSPPTRAAFVELGQSVAVGVRLRDAGIFAANRGHSGI